MKNKCWVVYGQTESTDDLIPLVFLHPPEMIEIENIYRGMYPDEYSSVGFVHWSIQNSEIRE